ncbi:MAG TPA: urease subunit gamma [Actinomycetota bacterium]
MHLNPTEDDRLRVFTVAQLARATLARGLSLNAPEAIALVCDEMHMAARASGTFDGVMSAGRAALTEDQVMEGVADLVPEIRVEVLLDEGTRLLVVPQPFGRGSPDGPGGIRFADGDVALVPDRERLRMSVTNAGVRPVRISSHYPFWQVNPSLEFDRGQAEGFRLDLPAGDSLRWAPGETREVELVAYGGGDR